MPDVKLRVDYVSSLRGGDGVLREVVELIVKAQGKYAGFLAKYLA
jgi:3-deoxy-D-manno-octulosonate 8-phosphate phosphatase KdsC-like HAD superfamily phosphatase